jgi:hypothetical protein
MEQKTLTDPLVATGGLHPLIFTDTIELYKRADKSAQALLGAQRLLQKYGLSKLLDHTERIGSHEDHYTVFGQNRRVCADRYWVTLRMKPDAKEAVRQTVFAALDRTGNWEKSFHVERIYDRNLAPYALVETWVINRIDPISRTECTTSACSRITLVFRRPVTEGERITDTCSVELVTETTNAMSTQKLAVVCSKPETA